MEVLSILRHAQGGRAFENLATAFDVEPQQAEAVMASVVPELAHAIERNTLSRSGLADLVAALGSGRHEGYLNDPNVAANPSIVTEGNAILGHVVGSKDRSRALAATAASRSGLSETLIKAMLPTIAAMAMGALAKGAKGGLGDILARLPGITGGAKRSGGLQPPQGLPTTGGGDMAGQSPLPLPGEIRPDRGSGSGGAGTSAPADNPYGDLSDILRKGAGGVAGGGLLWGLVRGVLGVLLGFRSRGILGWILRVVVARWGWSLLRALFGRGLGGR